MNNEEPDQTIPANVQIGTTGHKLPEQAKLPNLVIPRPFGIIHLINQWQPMGIRIGLKLPFVSNDQDFLFLLRNGPFIPRWDHQFTDENAKAGYPDPKPKDKEASLFCWNNMRNVYIGGNSWKLQPLSESGITITQYDYPPILATLAASFRRWRGDMQYRFRVVAGFATQCYVIVTSIKNAFSPIAVYDEYVSQPSIPRQDLSYRESMQNSYILADTSMFRHIEVTMPYDYPASYYDQYAWMARRCSPSSTCTSTKEKPENAITHEPHGDNWIGFAIRGQLAATQTGSQIFIELEYRACEGFQFADPGLPLQQFTAPVYNAKLSSYPEQLNSKIVPFNKWISDGLGNISLREKPKPEVEDDITTKKPAHHHHHHGHVDNKDKRPGNTHSGRETGDYYQGIDGNWYYKKDGSRYARSIPEDDRETRSLGRREREFA